MTDSLLQSPVPMGLQWSAAWDSVINSGYLGLFITLLSFQLGLKLFALSKRNPLLHPVLVSVLATCAVLLSLNISFAQYYQGAQFLSLLLGPVIVALAVPLYENLKALRQYWLPFLLANVLGGAATIGIAVALSHTFGLSTETTASMWTKSITTAFAIELAPELGGIAAVAAAIVMVTGIVGAVIGPWLFRLTGIEHSAAQGTALGICAHAVGTARALELGSQQGAFAALSMSVMGILCAFVLPWLV